MEQQQKEIDSIVLLRRLPCIFGVIIRIVEIVTHINTMLTYFHAIELAIIYTNMRK